MPLDLSILKGWQLPPEAVVLARVLISRLPEYQRIGGKKYPLRSELDHIISDGDVDLEDFLHAYQLWNDAAAESPSTPLPGSGGGTSVPQQPTQPGIKVARIELRIEDFTGPLRSGAPELLYSLHGEQIVLAMPPDENGDKQTTIDDGSRLSVGAYLYDESGRGIRYDLDPLGTPPGETNHPEFLGRVRFEAHDPKTGELLGAIGGGGLDDSKHVEGPVHFLDPAPPKAPGSWRRSGGAWVTMAIRKQCRVKATLDGLTSNAFIVPPFAGQ